MFKICLNGFFHVYINNLAYIKVSLCVYSVLEFTVFLNMKYIAQKWKFCKKLHSEKSF